MNEALIQHLQALIVDLEQRKEDYYADNHNQTDSHVMWLCGQIDAHLVTIAHLKKGA